MRNRLPVLAGLVVLAGCYTLPVTTVLDDDRTQLAPPLPATKIDVEASELSWDTDAMRGFDGRGTRAEVAQYLDVLLRGDHADAVPGRFRMNVKFGGMISYDVTVTLELEVGSRRWRAFGRASSGLLDRLAANTRAGYAIGKATREALTDMARQLVSIDGTRVGSLP